MLGLYAVTRFLLEIIRTDEGSFAGTGLTISQNVSLGVLVCAVGLAWWTWRRPERGARAKSRAGTLGRGLLLVLAVCWGSSCGPREAAGPEPSGPGRSESTEAAPRAAGMDWDAQVQAIVAGTRQELVSAADTLTRTQLQQLATLTDLRRLSLAARLSDDQLEFLDALPQLESLRMEQAPVGDHGLQRIGRRPNLRFLNLPRARCTDAGLEQLAGAPELQLLRLHSPRMTDQGLIAITRLPRLRFLHLIDVPITDDGLAALYPLTQLESFYLDGSSVTEAGLSRLLEQLPNLHLHWNDGHLDSDPGAATHRHEN